MKYTLDEYVRLSDDVYYPVIYFDKPSEILENSKENLKNFHGFYENSFLKYYHGWNREFFEPPKPNGFFAVYYTKNGKNNSGVIVFRGSDDYFDFLHHDLKIAMGEWPYVYNDALKFYYDVVKKFNPKFLSFAGHSLGGALAQLVGIEANKTKPQNQKHPIICFNAPQMGYLLHDNPNKKLLSNIDTKNKYYENNIYHQETLNYCTPHALTAKHHNQTFSEKVISGLSSMWQSIVCSTRMVDNAAINYGKPINFASDTIDNLTNIYKHIAKYKNLKETINHGQPAFNAAYNLLNINSKEKIIPNDQNFVNTIKQNEQKYNYIFNFNSHYDLVHVCGKPLGYSLSIDIDKKEYIPYWLSCGSDKKFNNYNDYLKSRCYEVRQNLELRVLVSIGSNLERASQLGKVDIAAKDLLNLKIANYFDKPTLGKLHFDELFYMVGIQHSMKNLGNVVLNEPMLAGMNLGANYIDAIGKFKLYKDRFIKQEVRKVV